MPDYEAKIQHLRLKDYKTKPWKNGKGVTQDILLMPEGAGHDSFDVRFALSPIVEEAKFSSFLGADRVITVIEGNKLELAFDATTVSLERYESHGFDTGLTPIGKPIDGSVLVVNVMARRGIWDIASCEVKSDYKVSCVDGDMLFLYGVSGDTSVSLEGKETALNSTETLLISGATDATIVSDGKFLVSHLKPVA
jgi:environmental stress-induced protein Ves